MGRGVDHQRPLPFKLIGIDTAHHLRRDRHDDGHGVSTATAEHMAHGNPGFVEGHIPRDLSQAATLEAADSEGSAPADHRFTPERRARIGKFQSYGGLGSPGE